MIIVFQSLATVFSFLLLPLLLAFLFQMPIGFHQGFLNLVLFLSPVAGGLSLAVWRKQKPVGRILLFVGLGLGVISLLVQCSSSEIWRAGDFYKLGAGPSAQEAKADFLARPDQLLRLSTRTMAYHMTNKNQGLEVNIGGKTVQLTSQFQIDEENGTILRLTRDGREGLFWVFPIDFGGFGSALSQPYAPGYILISATEVSPEPEFILTQKFVYTPNGFFLHNLRYHLYLTRPDLAIEEIHLELDPAQKAHWVALLSQPQVGTEGYDISHVAFIDPETGATEVMTLADFRGRRAQGEFRWVNRVIPENVAARRLDWFWKLSGGWLNSVGLPGQNVLQRTPYSSSELWFLPLKDRNVWLSGITSLNNNDSSLVNFSLVDTISGEVFYIKARGTEEDGAVSIVTGALGADAQVWRPVLPNPLLLDGKLYWALVVTDKQDLFRRLALLPLDSTGKVYLGDTWASVKAQAQSGIQDAAAVQAGNPVQDEVILHLTRSEYDSLKTILKKLEAEGGRR